MGGISKLSPLLGVLWSMCLVQGLVGGGHHLSVNSSLSEKEDVQSESARCKLEGATSVMIPV
jgi:hypothetical protein